MGKRYRPTSLAHPYWWPSWLATSLVWLIGQLPWNMLLAIGRAIGRLVWRLGGSRRRVAETNIRLCFPELSPQQQQQLSREAVISTGEALMETIGTLSNQRIDLGKRLHITGREHVDAAIN